MKRLSKFYILLSNIKKLICVLISCSLLFSEFVNAQALPSKERAISSENINEKTQPIAQSQSLSSAFLATNENSSTFSQADSKTLGFIEEVNKNTGDFNLKYPLFKNDIKGVNAGLNFSLTYNSGQALTPSSTYLPNGWSFELPHIDITQGSLNKTVFFDGNSYVYDPYYADNTGYKSGLKYLNNHGIKFSQYLTIQSIVLPDVGDIYYNYSLKLQDGRVIFFDNFGKPVAEKDRFDNYIAYFYFENLTYNSSRIKEIRGLYSKQAVKFSYDSNAIFVTYPNGAKTTLWVSAQNLIRIDSATSESLILSYNNSSFDHLVTSLTNAAGLNTQVEYNNFIPINSCEQIYNKPAVSKIYHLDLTTPQNEVLDSTQYAYGNVTGKYYSGFPDIKNCSLTKIDSLMDSNKFKYIYNVDEVKSGTIKTLDEYGQIVTKNVNFLKRSYFNNLHLPIQIENYTSDLPSNIPYSITKYTYNVTHDIKSMNPSYTMPISILTEVYDKSSQSYKPSFYEENTYDSYNNKLTNLRFEYSFALQNWQPVEKKQYTYFHNNPENDYSLPKSEDDIDLIYHKTNSIRYTLSEDKKSILTKIKGTLSDNNEFIPFLSETTQLDNFGRTILVASECLERTSGICSNGVSKKISQTSYVYDNEKSQLTIIEKDALENNWTTIIDANIGKEIEKISPSGQITSRISYDIIGREVQKLTPIFDGTFTTITTIYNSFQLSKQNSIVQYNNKNNYRTTTLFDALGRDIEKYDNFSPEKNIIDNSIERFLSAKQYTIFDKIDSETNILHQKIDYFYDANNREIGRSDVNHNINSIIFNDFLHSKTTYINNIIASSEEYNSLGKVIISRQYPNQKYNCNINPLIKRFCNQLNTENNKYIIEEKTSYDAFGNKVQNVKYSINSLTSNSELLTQSNFSYNSFGNLTKTITKGYDGVVETKDTQYDMLGNIVQFGKQKTDLKGNNLPPYISEKYTYNALSKLVTVTRQDAVTEKYFYNSDGNLVKKVNYSGLVHNYKYFQNNLLKTESIELPISVSYINAVKFLKEKTNFIFNLFSTHNSGSIANKNDEYWTNKYNQYLSQNEINYSYNNTGSLESISYAKEGNIDQNSIITFHYLFDGKTIESINYQNNSKIIYSYDNFGRIKTEKDTNENVTTYNYEANDSQYNDRLISVTHNRSGDKEVYNYYDELSPNENGILGSLQNITSLDKNNKIIRTKYSLTDPMHRVALLVDFDSQKNIIQEIISKFDKYQKNTEIQYSSTLYPIDDVNYTLKYNYDSANSLLGFNKFYTISNPTNEFPNYAEEYIYDSNYNIITKNVFRQNILLKSINYLYNNISQLISVNENSKHTSLSYDLDGNMILDDLGNRYTYDHFYNKITEIRNNIGLLVAQYTYYPNGNRNSKYIPNRQLENTNVPTLFYYNKSGVLQNEVQDNSQTGSRVVASYLMSGKNISERFVESSNNDSSVPFKNLLATTYYGNSSKSVSKLLVGSNDSLQLNKKFDFTPYGDQVNSNGDSVLAGNYSIAHNPYGYELQNITDEESGLILLGARYYNPRLMRFMSMDSYSVDNKYAYADANPINNSDPSGHSTVGNIMKDIFYTVLPIMYSVIAIIGGLTSMLAGNPAGLALASAGVLGIASSSLSIAARHTEGQLSNALFWSSVGTGIAALVLGMVSPGLEEYVQNTRMAAFNAIPLAESNAGQAAAGPIGYAAPSDLELRMVSAIEAVPRGIDRFNSAMYSIPNGIERFASGMNRFASGAEEFFTAWNAISQPVRRGPF